jgi:Arc/MetJ-type ribon-helix-helix transcriptional regulator
MDIGIRISSENELYIDSAIASGFFQDRGHAVNTAIELLKRRQEHIKDVNLGIGQLEQGLGQTFDIDSIMAAIDERLHQAAK